MDKQLAQIMSFGVYVEETFDNKWCFKYQFPSQEIIIISGEDKGKTAAMFFVEFLKSMHYSIRHLYENKMFDLLKEKLALYKSWNDVNVDKTVEIVTRNMKL